MRDLTRDNFQSIYKQGYARVAAVSPRLVLGSPTQNVRRIIDLLEDVKNTGVAAVVFPEMCITGYCLGDLVFQDSLLEEAIDALSELAECSADWKAVVIVGLPLKKDGAIYNCAAVIQGGELLGVVPKSFLPTQGEFYERRYYASGLGSSGFVAVNGKSIPFGTDLLFEARDLPGFTFGVEICEDLWAPIPASSLLAASGAQIIFNLSASPARLGRKQIRSDICKEQSRRLLCAYLYSSAGEGESTTDLAWDGQCGIFETGSDLTSTIRKDAPEMFGDAFQSVTQDIDLKKISSLRARSGYFAVDTTQDNQYRKCYFKLSLGEQNYGFRRLIDRFPFLAQTRTETKAYLNEALLLQATALSARLKASKAKCVVLGISGGLDSSWALLVACLASDMMGWDRSSVVARTLPSFATSADTLETALDLMQSLEVDADDVDITPIAYELLTAIQHNAAIHSLDRLKEIARDESGSSQGLFDVTFENIQAGARTDYLFRLAGLKSGIVIGTGDMSESSLGWCTYGVGDQMSHYNVNVGLPKTLLQQLTVLIAETDLGDVNIDERVKAIVCNDRIKRALLEVVDRPISPELVPAVDNAIQSSEKNIGPYCLQDFYLYFVIRYGFSPARLAFLAVQAWSSEQEGGAWPEILPPIENDTFSFEEIVSWLGKFTERFYAFSQFKRSASPDGPKLLEAGGLSPRGDWRAPSDMGARSFWYSEIKALKELLD